MNNLSTFAALDANPLSKPCYLGAQHNRFNLLQRPRNVVVCSVKPSVASPSSLSVAGSPNSGPNRIESLTQVSGVLGCQWGDEGKGKLVDILAQHFDVVARCQVRQRNTLLALPDHFGILIVFFIIYFFFPGRS